MTVTLYIAHIGMDKENFYETREALSAVGFTEEVLCMYIYVYIERYVCIYVCMEMCIYRHICVYREIYAWKDARTPKNNI